MSERDAENKFQLTQEKGKLARVRSALAKEQAAYAAEDARFLARNKVLCTVYAHGVKSLSELQAKAGHFEKADVISYEAMVRRCCVTRSARARR